MIVNHKKDADKRQELVDDVSYMFFLYIDSAFFFSSAFFSSSAFPLSRVFLLGNLERY